MKDDGEINQNSPELVMPGKGDTLQLENLPAKYFLKKGSEDILFNQSNKE